MHIKRSYPEGYRQLLITVQEIQRCKQRKELKTSKAQRLRNELEFIWTSLRGRKGKARPLYLKGRAAFCNR